MPVPLGGSTNVTPLTPFGGPKVWTTPTDGLFTSPTSAMSTVIVARWPTVDDDGVTGAADDDGLLLPQPARAKVRIRAKPTSHTLIARELGRKEDIAADPMARCRCFRHPKRMNRGIPRRSRRCRPW